MCRDVIQLLTQYDVAQNDVMYLCTLLYNVIMQDNIR